MVSFFSPGAARYEERLCVFLSLPTKRLCFAASAEQVDSGLRQGRRSLMKYSEISAGPRGAEAGQGAGELLQLNKHGMLKDIDQISARSAFYLS